MVPSLGFLAALFALVIAITISIASEPQTESLRTPLARMLPRVMGFGRVGSAWLSLGALAPYLFGPHRYKANGLWYLSASPSK